MQERWSLESQFYWENVDVKNTHLGEKFVKSTDYQRILCSFMNWFHETFFKCNDTFCNWFLKANLDLFCPRIKIHSKYKHIKNVPALAILMSHYSFGSKSKLILIVHLGRKKKNNLFKLWSVRPTMSWSWPWFHQW